MICSWITVLHLFVCFPTLELTTFEQQVCSTKIGYANAVAFGTNSCKKKECDHIEQRSAHLAKMQCNLCGWLKRHQGGLCRFFWIFWILEICSVLEQSWKKVYSRTTTKSIQLLQPEHGFYQQNGLKRRLVSK